MAAKGGASPASPDDVVDSQALERENHSGQTRPLDFWNREVRHAALPELLLVYSEALSSGGSSSSAGPLLSLASNHRRTTTTIQSQSLSESLFKIKEKKKKRKNAREKQKQRSHFEMGTTSKMSMPTLELWLSCLTKPLSMMYLQGTEAVSGSWSQTLCDRRPPSPDAVDGQRRCCDVGGHHALPDSFGRRLKDLFLLICGHRQKSFCIQFENLTSQPHCYETIP